MDTCGHELSLDKSRVAYLCNTFGVPDHDRCRALGNSGAEVLALDWALTDSEYQWSIPAQPATYRRRRIPVQAGRLPDYLSGAWILCRQLAGFRPDLVLVYGYHNPAFFLVAVACRLSGAKVVTMNDSRFDDYGRKLQDELVKAAALRPYAACLAGSTSAKRYAEFLGVRDVQVYHCAIDTQRVREQSPSGDKIAFADRPFVCVARFVEKKNHNLLLNAFEDYVRTSDRPRRLVLIGYGPLDAEIRRRVEESAILSRHVSFRGYVEASDIPAMVHNALALILPSKSDQFGIVVTEALAAGTPALVSSNAGARDLVLDFVNGFTIDPANTLGWTRAMAHLDADEARWLEMSAAAAASVASADVGAFVSNVSALVGRGR